MTSPITPDGLHHPLTVSSIGSLAEQIEALRGERSVTASIATADPAQTKSWNLLSFLVTACSDEGEEGDDCDELAFSGEYNAPDVPSPLASWLLLRCSVADGWVYRLEADRVTLTHSDAEVTFLFA